MKAAGALLLFGAAWVAPILLAGAGGPWSAAIGALGVVILWGRLLPVACTEAGGSMLHSLAGLLLGLNVPLTLILAVAT